MTGSRRSAAIRTRTTPTTPATRARLERRTHVRALLELAPVEVAGLKFANRIGLAAGFDKNGVALPFWRGVGFGHVELGTVTPRPQPGNPPPRMWRFRGLNALGNSLRFPNDGAALVVLRFEFDHCLPEIRRAELLERLRARRATLPRDILAASKRQRRLHWLRPTGPVPPRRWQRRVDRRHPELTSLSAQPGRIFHH